MLLSGRRFLNGNIELGDCCICGGKTDENALPVIKALGKTYTDFDNTIKGTSGICCKECQAVLAAKSSRMKPILVVDPGKVIIITKDEIWDVINNPPKQFVLSIPYSYKKHHWIFAGLSTPEKMLIGTDNQTIIYEPKIHIKVTNAIIELKNMGVSSAQIISGNYHPSIMVKIGEKLDEMEKIIADERITGLVEFLVKYTPKAETKLTEFERDERMITTEQSNTATFLSLIAAGSRYRSNNGKQFWAGFFEHRINRVINNDFATATSKLMESVDYDTTCSNLLNDFINNIDEETENQIMKTLREQTKLSVVLAYDLLKKSREE